MKQKLFTLLLAVAASVGTMFAEKVQIGDLYYYLDATNQTAEVARDSSASGDIIIPSSVTYNSVSYSVTSIGDDAFYDCTGLTSVTIPNSVTDIGGYAFGYCSGLTSITIPNSVTSIGNYAFAYCSSLTSLSVEAGNTVYDSRNNCNAIIETSTNTLIFGCQNTTIPNSVTSIGESAFYECTGLTSVTIPNTVTSIGESAFYECTGLTSVTIPNSVTSIGDAVFRGCTGLTSVSIPNSVTSIGMEAFLGCSSLTSVTIPNSVTSIESWAFSGCSSLTSVTIPNSVTSIGDWAFGYCTGLTSVTIPNSVTSIGVSAFDGCTGLTSVIWNAKNCADFASNNTPFYADYYDEEWHYQIQFDLRPQITSFTFGNEVKYIPANLCNGMSNLTSVTIPNSVTNIGGSAFSGCSSLTSVTIPNSVTSIGDYAFYRCSGLTSVTIPNSVTSIEYSAFRYCTGLTSMEAPAGFFDVINEKNSWMYYTKILNHVTVNGGELTENALLFINRSYKTLWTLDVSGVSNTEFADEAFKGYYNLQQLVLPEGLQKVSYMMVAGCKNLQSINIPASVEEIEQAAFEDCRSIKTITFGGSSSNPAPGRFNAPAASTSLLRRIGNWAFYNAHELQHLDIPEGVTEIGDGAFYGCTYLEDMTFPASIQAIGDNCFALCAKLTKITCNAVTPPTIQAKTFYDVKRQIPVYVPDEAVSAYEDDTYWQEFDIQGQSEVPQGIDNTPFPSGEGRGEALKLLRDGQIFILRGEKVYTLTGAEVK